MDPGTVIALASTGVAAIISVTVPWMTFRLALRQDHIRWLREQRALLYLDLLTEAYAERQWFEHHMADDQIRERMNERFVDLRLPQLERARLGARSALFASRTVNQLFGRLRVEGSRASLSPGAREGARLVGRVEMGRAFDALEAAVRGEIGADRLPPMSEDPPPPRDAAR